ncbi:hypothetical protein TNCV_3848381 [Trichonephila clavipes]|uniref:Uncharacterized protein n=1 Tax=Trichonephila clavipes TaxID=2585209 RepID=A0A8X6R8A1_TRICX|nr:hypothetical protein TNCV_3848381 [Trichonephila clavipes]
MVSHCQSLGASFWGGNCASKLLAVIGIRLYDIALKRAPGDLQRNNDFIIRKPPVETLGEESVQFRLSLSLKPSRISVVDSDLQDSEH